MNQFENIPDELRAAPLWLQYYLSADSKHPDKKPRKHPCVKYATPEDRKANLRPLDKLLERPATAGVQRWIDKAEGFTFVDIDRVRDPETGDVEEWALELIDELDTYCELSASGKGFHLIARATLPRDFHVDPDQVEIYAGNTSNKLMALTGDVFDLHGLINERQDVLNALLSRVEARAFNKEAPLASESGPPPLDAPDPKYWRDVFHTGSELDQRPGVVFIKGFLEEGITAIGSLSGVGKTWIGLSISHALITGEPLFGCFPVQKRANVLYLVPEMGGRKFRERLIKMRIPQDGGFFCQTVRDGACDLNEPFLLQALADMKPIIVLDTAIRFAPGEENSSTETAQGLGARLFNLINHGAQGVICMHHRSKGSANQELSLENALRGSGDFGAMADCVWAVEHAKKEASTTYLKESQTLTRLWVECVKPRDMEPADPFVIQGRPFIDTVGDFRLISDREEEPQNETRDDASHKSKIRTLVEKQPEIGIRKIAGTLGIGTGHAQRLVAELGIKKVENKWVVPGLPVPPAANP